MVAETPAASASILGRVSSYVEWAPVIAGAVTAAAISFVLFTFGTAIGLTAVSPWEGSSLPAWLIAIIATLWLLIVQTGSYAFGGYLAGRLRAPIADALPAERTFRDGAHGFLVWALGVVIMAVVLAWTTGAIVKGAADAAATAASGAAQGLSNAAAGLSVPDPLNYSIDRLLRKTNGATTGDNKLQPAVSTPQSPESGQAIETDRDQARRILVSAVATGDLPAEDKTYLAGRVATLTGIPQADAEKRVDEAVAAIKKAKAEAKEAADKARRATAVAAFLTAAAALISAAAAAAGAGLGGRHRDENGMLRIFGRDRFW